MEVGFGGCGGDGRSEGILSLLILTDSEPKVTWSSFPAPPSTRSPFGPSVTMQILASGPNDPIKPTASTKG